MRQRANQTVAQDTDVVYVPILVRAIVKVAAVTLAVVDASIMHVRELPRINWKKKPTLANSLCRTLLV